MREKAQVWISVSNREQSMANVLSRADFNEGTVLHAHRAAFSSLMAILADNGLRSSSDRCEALCDTLAAHDITSPQDVLDAVKALDAHEQKLDTCATAEAPSETCTLDVVTECLDAVKRIRVFVNTVLTER